MSQSNSPQSMSLENTQSVAMVSPTNVNPSSPPRLQIVDENKSFTEELPTYMGKWNLVNAGFAYNVVAVFGSQSTGKSTLLNRLFHTDFSVMNEANRSQTTRGIWLSRASDQPTLIMDVEGTDGRERGEDQDFERKSSLFVLAIAEVIIINMWEHMVGLYHGANMGLLKTVLEVNLQLFQKTTSPKTHILFVIRDHASGTSINSLSTTLITDLTKIWVSLNKPDGLQSASLFDFFDISFTSLPHKRLASDQFESDVLELRKRFIDSNHPNYVFKPAYKKAVPSDGFPLFAVDIWQQINANRDLDLPTQQELLAQFRCDELSAATIESYSMALDVIKSQVETGAMIEALGGVLDAALESSLTSFDTQASRYHQGVYQRKRTMLLERAHILAFTVVTVHLRNAIRRSINMFKSELDLKLKNKATDFYTVVESTRDETVQLFTTIANASCMTNTKWSFESLMTDLNTELEQIITQRRDEELNKMLQTAVLNIQSELPEAVSDILERPSSTMWTQVDNKFRTEVEAREQIVKEGSKSLRLSEEELWEILTKLRIASVTKLKDILANVTSEMSLIQRLKTVFEAKFRYDDRGIPRVWQPSDDIDGIYRRAREVTDGILKLFLVVELPYVNELESSTRETSITPTESIENLQTSIDELRKPLIPTSKAATLQSRFRLETDAIYMDAKRSMVSSSPHIPRWVLIIIAILGYNEFMSILSNPILLLFLILLSTSAFVLHATGTLNPLLIIITRVGRETARQVGLYIRDATGGRGVMGAVNEIVLNPMRLSPTSSQHNKEQDIPMSDQTKPDKLD